MTSAGDLVDWARSHAGGQLVSDSRRAAHGDVFLAYPGDANDGRRFIPAAVDRGAAAVLFEAEAFDWPAGIDVPHRAVADLQARAGEIADLAYGHPSRAMQSFAVTGTNGKTTSTHWIAQALSVLGKRPVLVGTLGAGFADRLDVTGYTTPDAVLLHSLLAGYRARGADALAIEASSIGLVEDRLASLHIDVAVFTNLTHDHLDYHGTMAAYASAKRQLFDWPQLRAAVFNLDDATGASFADELAGASALRVIGTRVVRGWQKAADDAGIEVVRAEDIEHDASGLRFVLRHEGLVATVKLATVGDYNVSNWLGCYAALVGAGHAPQAVLDALSGVQPVDGRMQLIARERAPLVVVDYAHSPDALDQLLVSLRPIATVRNGRLVVVVGCGGDRDPAKRAVMGGIASRLADRTVLTSDNPRSEDPQSILDAMRRGAVADADVVDVVDRQRAIREAITRAAADDVVVIAGKGHERTQEIKGVKLPFHDAAEAERALDLRAEVAAC
ncbi:UDP-N-acetylmuramoyl-L-alanyl-D-glutamate--2,6-diaminopimelate ligase [soil metagenome]